MTTQGMTRGPDARGLTLIEVMIAAGVMAVGLSALLTAVPFATYGTREGYQLSTATFLANERLEQVRNARWESVPRPVDQLGVSASATAPPATGGVVTFPDEPTLAAPHEQYARVVRIADCGAGACAGIARSDLRQVTVTVAYRPMTGVGVAGPDRLKMATVTTFVAKRCRRDRSASGASAGPSPSPETGAASRCPWRS
jgi:prepilin-type N-terminal cleavage/methylation domain-containing protein